MERRDVSLAPAATTKGSGTHGAPVFSSTSPPLLDYKPKSTAMANTFKRKPISDNDNVLERRVSPRTVLSNSEPTATTRPSSGGIAILHAGIIKPSVVASHIDVISDHHGLVYFHQRQSEQWLCEANWRSYLDQLSSQKITAALYQPPSTTFTNAALVYDGTGRYTPMGRQDGPERYGIKGLKGKEKDI